jgi:hypothetical protein
MTSTELSDFLKNVFAAYPGYRDWLERICKDNYAEAIVAMGRHLKAVTLDEAMEVLTGWIDGTLSNAPIGFDREAFALNVRSFANAARDKRNRQTIVDRQREEAELKWQRKHNRSAAFKSIAVPFAKILTLRQAVMDGRMDLEECESQIATLIEDF